MHGKVVPIQSYLTYEALSNRKCLVLQYPTFQFFGFSKLGSNLKV